MNETIVLTHDLKEEVDYNSVWHQYRVIFTTPSILNDALDNQLVPKLKIKSIVLDDCHKAIGHDVRAKVIQRIHDTNPDIRILGLCVMPGERENNVIMLMRKLRITHVECRDENSPDLNLHIQKREPKAIVVAPPDLKFLERYEAIIMPHKNILVKNGILKSSDKYMGYQWILMERRKYQQRQAECTKLIGTFDVLLQMIRGLDIMNRQGLRSFIRFFQRDSSKAAEVMARDLPLENLINDIQQSLGNYPDVLSMINNGAIDIIGKYSFGELFLVNN